jgi:anti-sigma regulatory factor (Ser/Thr protein kinase)
MRTSRRFPAVPESTRAARRFVLQAAGDVPPALQDAIAVMVAELAMNAVQHAGTEFEVIIERAGATMRVEVTDSGGGRPAVHPMPPPQSLRGRGLPIVDSLAQAWGVIPSPRGPGKSIWFQISMPPVTPEHTVTSEDVNSAAVVRGGWPEEAPPDTPGRHAPSARNRRNCNGIWQTTTLIKHAARSSSLARRPPRSARRNRPEQYDGHSARWLFCPLGWAAVTFSDRCRAARIVSALGLRASSSPLPLDAAGMRMRIKPTWHRYRAGPTCVIRIVLQSCHGRRDRARGREDAQRT